MRSKICTKCRVEKSLSEFYKDKGTKDGLSYQCKKCYKKYREANKGYYKNYRKENKEKINKQKAEWKEKNKGYYKQWREENKEKIKNYYYENKESIAENNKQWREENKESIAEYSKQYYYENKESILEYSKQYYKENAEKINEYKKQWQKNNPDKVREISQKRRARKAALPHTLTLEEWGEILEYFDYGCAYCDRPNDFTLEQDHIIPVSKGGGYTRENIIPACKPCNSSKDRRDLKEWYKEQEFFDSSKLEKIEGRF